MGGACLSPTLFRKGRPVVPRLTRPPPRAARPHATTLVILISSLMLKPPAVILSEAKNLIRYVNGQALRCKKKQILRYAQDDKEGSE